VEGKRGKHIRVAKEKWWVLAPTLMQRVRRERNVAKRKQCINSFQCEGKGKTGATPLFVQSGPSKRGPRLLQYGKKDIRQGVERPVRILSAFWTRAGGGRLREPAARRTLHCSNDKGKMYP